LLPSEEEGADSKTQKLSDINIGVEFNGDGILLKNSAGDVSIEVSKLEYACSWPHQASLDL